MDVESPFPERKMLDLVFIQDATGSQGSYITHSTEHIQRICADIISHGGLASQEDLRVGLIAFRDHPPQDHTYVTKNFGFTSNINQVHENLKTLYASGGGDGPEAVTASLWEALNLDWRPLASKMIVLIADAPPHGIGEYGDGFDAGSPDGHDPLVIARELAQRGIVLFFVACEPALSGYAHANDFYTALTAITSGLMVPLTTASLLSRAIIGSVLENLDMERLIREVGAAVAERILGGQQSVDDVARELHEKLLLRGDGVKRMVVENIYRESEEAKHNVHTWTNARTIQDARPHLKKVNKHESTQIETNHTHRLKARALPTNTSAWDTPPGHTDLHPHLRHALHPPALHHARRATRRPLHPAAASSPISLRLRLVPRAFPSLEPESKRRTPCLVEMRLVRAGSEACAIRRRL
ncbi:elongation factor-2 kinase [Rhizoctonia solani AG-3 Rhs1AP]|uniref:Elongation factor-2 kinase n=1 Tax=Rhizoctonia solani AG-3 Rhs1AP TaxID=1086054 RepID=X8JVZ4_9AGAM|nr:elongation factor-2 kinase [Rhizoctonia solani AG-3 Rhs1AP]